MATKYDSLRKIETDANNLKIAEFESATDTAINDFRSTFSGGVISLDSPYIQKVINDINTERAAGLSEINQQFQTKILDISNQENQSYINTIIDVVNIGLGLFKGGSLINNAVNTAQNKTDERRKLDPKAPETPVSIPYADVGKAILSPALNSASNIISRYNFRYNRLIR